MMNMNFQSRFHSTLRRSAVWGQLKYLLLLRIKARTIRSYVPDINFELNFDDSRSLWSIARSCQLSQMTSSLQATRLPTSSIAILKVTVSMMSPGILNSLSNSWHLYMKDRHLATCASSSILIMKYAMKHNITKDALVDMLDLIRLHCPIPNMCPSTLYYFKKQFQCLRLSSKLSLLL